MAKRPEAFWILLVFLILAAGLVTAREFWPTLAQNSVGPTLQTVGVLVGGLVAIVLGVWRSVVAERQANTALGATLHDRFERAAALLASDAAAVRIAQIYVLERLAQDHPEEYHVQVLETLCAFIRNSKNPNNEPAVPIEGKHGAEVHWKRSAIGEDVQAAVDAIGVRIGRRLDLESRRRFRFDFRGADLQGARLRGLDFSPAKWKSSFYKGAAELFQHWRADFTDAKLCGADMNFADFSDADLKDACLCMAQLPRKLCHTRLAGCNFSHAWMHGTDLTGAKFNAGIFLDDAFRPARGLTQEDLDKCTAQPTDLPDLEGVVGESGDPLIWRGGVPNG